MFNLFAKMFPFLCVDNDMWITGKDYECKKTESFKLEEQKRALSEFKSARTLIKKALMRINSKRLGKVLYELDNLIVETELELKDKKLY